MYITIKQQIADGGADDIVASVNSAQDELLVYVKSGGTNTLSFDASNNVATVPANQWYASASIDTAIFKIDFCFS